MNLTKASENPSDSIRLLLKLIKDMLLGDFIVYYIFIQLNYFYPVIGSYICDMKKIPLVLLIFFSVTLFGQYDKTYYILDLEPINDSISKRIESYVSVFSHDLNRSSALDNRARIRNSYFISVIQQTSMTGKTFSSMVDSIPGGKIGHSECFGNSDYFSPAKVGFPELFPVFTEINLKVKGEIMYQVIWTNTLNERQTSHTQLVQKAVGDIKKAYKVDKLSQKVISEYKNSKSHNTIIKERGGGKYGSSTMVIISEKKLSNSKWSYEIMIRNLIIFTEPINQ